MHKIYRINFQLINKLLFEKKKNLLFGKHIINFLGYFFRLSLSKRGDDVYKYDVIEYECKESKED